MRPGWLFFSLFIWLVFTGGRFTSSFLQNVAGFDDALVGLTIGLQILISSLLGSVGAVVADHFEFIYPRRGRIGILIVGVLLGTLSFEIHYLVQLMNLGSSKSKVFHVIARILYAVFSAIIFPTLDGITLSYLKSHNCDESSYGKERLFGAVAWAIASIIAGPVLDEVGFTVFFISAPIGALICLATFAKYGIDSISYDSIKGYDVKENEMVVLGQQQQNNECPLHGEQIKEENETRNVKFENKSIVQFRSMFYSFTACGFIISSLFLSMGTSVVENLIFLFFESLGGSSTICGLTVVVTVIFEIPIFHYAPKLLSYFGAEALQKIACFAYIVRVVGYTFVQKEHVAWVLIFEPLHGVTYACSKTSSVEFAARITPKGYEASGQGFLSMLLGIGSVVGLSLGGWIEDVFGAVTLYRSYACTVAVGLAIFYISIAVDQGRRVAEDDGGIETRQKINT